ncbi:MAG: CoA transferase [Chloroflexi bacterium]|nr:CoA transferase [Chloroflexota bacterium]
MMPLEGIRIADFTWHAAGPSGVLLLSLLGAQVIKVESHRSAMHRRAVMFQTQLKAREDDLNHGRIFNDLHLNALSVTLDFTQPQAADLVRRLVVVSDVAAENFRGGVLARYGLDYVSLRRWNPSLVMVSATNSGQVGPEATYMGYASIFSALGGMSLLTGFADAPPAEMVRAAGDLRVGSNVAFAMLAALHYRRRTGEGQYIDLSARECFSSYIGDVIMDYAMNQRVAERRGNKDDVMAPHDCYPCAGEDQWISVAVATDAEWEAFCRAAGRPDWAADPRFADQYLRKKNEAELDKLISAWARQQSRDELVQRLREAGVAVAPSLSVAELYADPHLRGRSMFDTVDHPAAGRHDKVGAPWRFSRTPAAIQRHAPLIGQDTSFALGEVLGLPAADVARLQEQRIAY